jgi:hypothetical protein
MFTSALFCVASFQIPRSWPEVLRTALTNYFALFALVILVSGPLAVVPSKKLGQGCGSTRYLCRGCFTGLVLRDIKAEIPSRRATVQQSPNAVH